MAISVDGNAYNRLVNLDSIEFRIIDYLARSTTKYSDYLFKILKYDTEDCLSKPSLDYMERMSLLYTGNGDVDDNRVFMNPYVDDAFDEQSSHLHIYVDSIVPITHISSTVNVAFETIVHNKISNIYGDADPNNSRTNPSELNKNGEPTILYKSRESVLLKCLIAELNGAFINGVGTLQFNIKVSGSGSMAKMSLWNGKKFFGHKTILSSLISGASVGPECGF